MGWAWAVATALPQHTALTSCIASPWLLMASTSLILQPSQKSAVSTRWEKVRLSSVDPCCWFSRPPPKEGPRPAHLAGLVPVYTRDHNIVEALQLPCTALSIVALILEVQLLGQGPLQVLGATNGWFESVLGLVPTTSYLQTTVPSSGGTTCKTQLKLKLGCMSPTSCSRSSSVCISPSKRSCRSAYCTCSRQERYETGATTKAQSPPIPR